MLKPQVRGISAQRSLEAGKHTMSRKKGKKEKPEKYYYLEVYLQLTRDGRFSSKFGKGWGSGEVSESYYPGPESKRMETFANALIERLWNATYYSIQRSKGVSEGRFFPDRAYNSLVAKIIEQLGEPGPDDFIEGRSHACVPILKGYD